MASCSAGLQFSLAASVGGRVLVASGRFGIGRGLLLVGSHAVEGNRLRRNGPGEQNLKEENDDVGDDQVLDDWRQVHAPGREAGGIAAVTSVVAALYSHDHKPAG